MLNKSFLTHWLQLELKTTRSKNIDFQLTSMTQKRLCLNSLNTYSLISFVRKNNKISGKVLHFLTVRKMRVGQKKPRQQKDLCSSPGVLPPKQISKKNIEYSVRYKAQKREKLRYWPVKNAWIYYVNVQKWCHWPQKDA